MGVKHLWKLIQECGSKQIPRNKRLAVDSSMWVYHYKNSPKERIVYYISRRLMQLLVDKNKLVFVFDGKTPELKMRTMIRRKNKRDNVSKQARNFLKNVNCQVCMSSSQICGCFLVKSNKEHTKEIMGIAQGIRANPIVGEWGDTLISADELNSRVAIYSSLNGGDGPVNQQNLQANTLDFIDKQLNVIVNRRKNKQMVGRHNKSKLRRVHGNCKKGYKLTEDDLLSSFSSRFKIDNLKVLKDAAVCYTPKIEKTDRFIDLKEVDRIFSVEQCVKTKQDLLEHSTQRARLCNKSLDHSINTVQTVKLKHDLLKAAFGEVRSGHAECVLQRPILNDIKSRKNPSISAYDRLCDNPKFNCLNDTSLHIEETEISKDGLTGTFNKEFPVIECRPIIYLIKSVLDAFDIPYYDAPLEADMQCGDLFRRGLIEGAISDDNDFFMFGCRKVFRHYFKKGKDVILYDLDRSLYSETDLIKYSSLAGSDYCMGKKGFGYAKSKDGFTKINQSDIRNLIDIYQSPIVKPIKEIYWKKQNFKKIYNFWKNSGIKSTELETLARTLLTIT